MYMKISIIKEMKNNFLESSYTAVNWICHWGKRWSSERYRLRVCQLCKSTVRIWKLFLIVMQVKSYIIFEVMFYIDEDLNN